MANVKLSNVIRRAQTKVDKDDTDLVFYVGGEHIESENIRVHSRGIIAESTIGPMFYYGFKAGDFLLVSRNPHLKKAGLVDFDGICSEKTFVLETANSDVLLPEFLPFVLQNERFWDYAYRHRHGSTNTFINWSTLANYEFELPDLETQRKLAEVLWSINDTMEAYKNLISATDELVKSQFMELFSLSQAESNGWSIVPVSSVVIKPLSGEWGQEDTDGTGVKVLRTTNFTDSGFIDYSEVVRRSIELKKVEAKALRDGDVLIEKSGGSDTKPVGRVVFYQETSENFLFNNFTALLRPNTPKLNSRFLFTFLFVTYWNGGTKLYENKTTGIHNLKLADYLDNTMIPIPPIEDQEVFAAFVRQSDKSKFELEQALAELNATYKRIIAENLG